MKSAKRIVLVVVIEHTPRSSVERGAEVGDTYGEVEEIKKRFQNNRMVCYVKLNNGKCVGLQRYVIKTVAM